MTVEFTIDWLNYTVSEPGPKHATACAFPCENTWESTNAGKGYDLAATNDLHIRVSWHSERADMGVHVQYSGNCLNRFRAQQTAPKTIAQYHQRHKHRCSRIDLALDAKNEGLSILRLASYVRRGKAITQTEKYSHIKSQDGGETLYIGSRTSEMFLRVYNKAAEQGNKPENPDDWIRIELECKGERAKQIGAVLASSSEAHMTTFARGLIKDFIDFPYGVWRRCVGDDPIHIAKSQEKSGKTREWLLRTVAPAMARYIQETGDRAIMREFEEFLRTNVGEQKP